MSGLCMCPRWCMPSRVDHTGRLAIHWIIRLLNTINNLFDFVNHVSHQLINLTVSWFYRWHHCRVSPPQLKAYPTHKFVGFGLNAPFQLTIWHLKSIKRKIYGWTKFFYSKHNHPMEYASNHFSPLFKSVAKPSFALSLSQFTAMKECETSST